MLMSLIRHVALHSPEIFLKKLRFLLPQKNFTIVFILSGVSVAPTFVIRTTAMLVLLMV
jgi:hypothetical protein